MRFDEELIEMLLQVKWWDFEPEKLVDFLPLLCDTDVKKIREQLRQELKKSLTQSFTNWKEASSPYFMFIHLLPVLQDGNFCDNRQTYSSFEKCIETWFFAPDIAT